jgi:CRP-like cAMP-binding protein
MQIESLFRLESLVVISLLFKGLGYLVRDELLLRVLVTLGIICDVFFYALQPVPILPPVISSLILIAINLGILMIVILERTTLAMTEREKRLFSAFDTLSPGQFRKLKRLGQFHTATERTVILQEGEVPTSLYYVEGASFELKKGEFVATVDSPAFAGEIAYLTGGGASATVTLMPGTDHVVWSVADLRKLSRRNRALGNALIARFSLDLAQKVTNSFPTGALAEIRSQVPAVPPSNPPQPSA